MISKANLAARFGVSEKTIDNWAKSAQLHPYYQGKRRVFSDADVAAIMKVAGREEDGGIGATDAIVVATGNHQTVLPNPAPMTNLTLEHLRLAESVSFEDPLAVAQSIIATAEQVKAAMQRDLATRQRQLSATQQAAAQVQAAIADLRHEQLVYRLQTTPIDQATTQATGELQQALGELQKLRGGNNF